MTILYKENKPPTELAPIAGRVIMPTLSGSTYRTLEDWFKIYGSVGRISGGAVTDNGDGTVAVAAGTGFIRTTASSIGRLLFFNWVADTSTSLTNTSINYLYIDYNSGSPIVAATTTESNINNQTKFKIADIYRSGTTLIIQEHGLDIPEFLYKIYDRFKNNIQRTSGLITGETGTRNITVSAGTFYDCLDKITITAKDTSSTDTFSYWYYNGSAWIEVATQSAIDNTQYNNIASGLATLTAGKYGVHWVYIAEDNTLHVVYGQGDYILSDADDAQPPGSLPAKLTYFGFLIAKIIILKSASAFISSPEIAFETHYKGSIVMNHNDAANPQGGVPGSEEYHLTSTEYASLQRDCIQVLFVGKHGNDSYDGKRPEDAKLTFGAALTAAIALTPSASNRILIKCVDDGKYTESITCVSYVDIYAPIATIAPSTGTAITLADDTKIFLGEITPASASTAVAYSTGSGTSNLTVSKINLNGASIAYNIAAGVTLNLVCNTLSGTETNAGTINTIRYTGKTVITTEDNPSIITLDNSNIEIENTNATQRNFKITSTKAGDTTLTFQENFIINDGYDIGITSEDASTSVVFDNANFEVENTYTTQRTIKIKTGTDANATITVEGEIAVIDSDLTQDAIVLHKGVKSQYSTDSDSDLNDVLSTGLVSAYGELIVSNETISGFDEFNFTVSGVSVNPSVGDVYSNNSSEFTISKVDITAGSGIISVYRSTGSNDPLASGDLTRVSGSGDATIAYSAYELNEIAVGIFRIEGKSVVVIITADGLFSRTKDTADSYNVYWETDQIKVQNKVGNNKSIKVGVFGTSITST